MRVLSEIIQSDYQVSGDKNVEISGITHDSRKVEKDNIFVCLPGQNTAGKNFVNDAIKRGARVIVADETIPVGENVVFVLVPEAVKALADISSNFYFAPSTKLNLIGITGTNGKTTVTYLLESIYKKAKTPAAVIGTINYRFGEEILQSTTTTPQSSELQYLLNKSVVDGYKYVVMEVSSHALALGRVRNCEFDVAIFTNLTRDHLDFHKTKEEYFLAKLKLFQMLELEGKKTGEKFAVLNNDDEYSQEILNSIKVKTITYGLKKKSDFTVKNLKNNIRNTKFTINDEIEISMNLIGKHNIYNALAAYACAKTQNIEPSVIKDGIEAVKIIPGRLESIDAGQKFGLFVDYAHTDDALKNVLRTLKELKHNRLITVFGCGGDRDRTKRPVMGEIAVNLSDWVIVTSDNPRTEEPEKITLDIEVGIRRTKKENYEIVPDREEAIKRAVYMAKEDDIILIAGKGHEEYQIIGEKRIPFSDREIAYKYLKR